MKVSVLCLVCLIGSSLAVTSDQEVLVKSYCQALIDSDSTFIAGFVRLSFHDCVGGCDGCIDLNLEDTATSDQPNAGLRRYITALETVYDNNNVGAIMNRADFWALCGAVAAEEGRSRSGTAAPLPIQVLYGREDCNAENPLSSGRATIEMFPNARHGLDGVLAWCENTFNMNDRECTALMGAHTLGRARTTASGYSGPWVAGVDVLDNAYYVDMLDSRRWAQTNPSGGSGASARWQYSDRNGAGGRLMLNTDMCFIKDIQPDDEGREVNSLDNIQLSSTAAYVAEFAMDNDLWLEEFGAVFTKMIQTGYDDDLKAPGEEEVEEEEVVQTTPPPRRPGDGSRPRNPPRSMIEKVLLRMLMDEE